MSQPLQRHGCKNVLIQVNVMGHNDVLEGKEKKNQVEQVTPAIQEVEGCGVREE